MEKVDKEKREYGTPLFLSPYCLFPFFPFPLSTFPLSIFPRGRDRDLT